MRQFEITELGQERTAWIYPEESGEFEPVHGDPEPGRVALKIRHFTPADQEALGRKMLAAGILKRKFKRGGDYVEMVPGREADRQEMFAAAMVVDWSSVVENGVPVPYSAAIMGRYFSKENGIFEAVSTACKEFDSFFGRNGHVS